MGLSISDAIRMLMRRVATEKRMPFEIREPNIASRRAKEELERGDGKQATSLDALMEDLHADD